MTNSEKFKVYLAYRCYLVSFFEGFCKSVLNDVLREEYCLENALHECHERAKGVNDAFRYYLRFCVDDGLFSMDASLQEYINFDMTINMYLKAVKNGRLGGISIYGK